MTARNRLPPWHELQHLSNGREVLIRPIRPDDAVPLRAGFALLQPDALRQRFLDMHGELSVEQAQRLTHPDPRTQFTIVVAEPLPPGEAMIGAVAQVAIADPASVDGRREAEFTILVSGFLAQMGLGRHLMRRLVRWSKGKRLECLHGNVPAHNLPMLAMAQSLGFHQEACETPGLMRVMLPLAAAAA